MMHQSSLGTLLVVIGSRSIRCGRRRSMPLLYLLTAIAMGYARRAVRVLRVGLGYRRSIEMHLLKPLSKVMLGVLSAYLVVRLGDLLVRGAILGDAFGCRSRR